MTIECDMTLAQGQGPSAHISKISIRAIAPHCEGGSGLYFTQLLSMTQRCVMTLTQDQMSYLQGQGHSAHIPEIRLRAITLYCQIAWE